MLGLMQSHQLLISSLMNSPNATTAKARRYPAGSRGYSPLHLQGCGGARRKVANALDKLNLAFGDRVATLAWNGYRHLELYFGVSGTGPGAAHPQSAAASRADRLDCQPCRRPGAVL